MKSLLLILIVFPLVSLAQSSAPRESVIDDIERTMKDPNAKSVLMVYQDGAYFYSEYKGKGVQAFRLQSGTETNQALSRSEKYGIDVRKFRSKAEDNSEHVRCQYVARPQEAAGAPMVKNVGFNVTYRFEDCKGTELLNKKAKNVMAEIQAAAKPLIETAFATD